MILAPPHIQVAFEDIMLSKYNIQATDACFESFAEWSLGPEWQKAHLSDTRAIWNSRHADLFELKPADLIRDTLPKMIEVWLNREEYKAGDGSCIDCNDYEQSLKEG